MHKVLLLRQYLCGSALRQAQGERFFSHFKHRFESHPCMLEHTEYWQLGRMLQQLLSFPKPAQFMRQLCHLAQQQ